MSLSFAIEITPSEVRELEQGAFDLRGDYFDNFLTCASVLASITSKRESYDDDYNNSTITYTHAKANGFRFLCFNSGYYWLSKSTQKQIYEIIDDDVQTKIEKQDGRDSADRQIGAQERTCSRESDLVSERCYRGKGRRDILASRGRDPEPLRYSRTGRRAGSFKLCKEAVRDSEGRTISF